VLLRAAGWLLGWLAGSVLRVRRTHVEESMRSAGIANADRCARAMYRELGRSAVEFLWLALVGRRALRVEESPIPRRFAARACGLHVRIEEESRARWTEALGLGRGVVVAASHTGNWDLAACAIARDVPLLVVTKRLRVRWLDRLWQGTRAAQGVMLAGARGALRRARGVLARGGAVAMMIDQVPERSRHAVDVDFLGRAALVDRAPAALAASARAPLVVAAARRGAGGEQVLHVLDVIVPPPRAGRAWVDAASAAATRALDRFVRTYPTQWLWLHRRWKRLDRRRGAGMLAVPCTTPSSSPAAPSRAA
jgi:KDO2-lipid IV(A) lauroyltransferase